MDARLVVLQRFVEALGKISSITDFDDRKRLQKAVYLGQLAGVDLGYRYGWYIRGPYSTDLTRDYYALSQALAGGEQPPADRQLKPEIKGKLDKIKPLLAVPNGVDLSRTAWLELIASWHYLRKVSRLDEEKARAMMAAQKPALAPFIVPAQDSLKAAGVL